MRQKCQASNFDHFSTIFNLERLKRSVGLQISMIAACNFSIPFIHMLFRDDSSHTET